MACGVTIEDPARTYIDADVIVEADTVIHPGVFLEGRTRVGARCEIYSGSRIVNSTLGDDVCLSSQEENLRLKKSVIFARRRLWYLQDPVGIQLVLFVEHVQRHSKTLVDCTK